MILIIVFIREFLSYYQIFMLIQKPHINDRFDIYAVGAVVLLEHNALLTDVIHKSAVAVRYEKLRFFSRQRKRKLDFCKKIAESFARLGGDHNKLTLSRENERAAAQVAFVQDGNYRFIGTAECRKQIHRNVQMFRTMLIGRITDVENNGCVRRFLKS